MNISLDRRGAGNGHAACRAAAPLAESMWKMHARSAGLHFDPTVLAELIALRWKQDRPYFALQKKRSGSVAGEPSGGSNRRGDFGAYQAGVYQGKLD